jgi:hypothetical protein
LDIKEKDIRETKDGISKTKGFLNTSETEPPKKLRQAIGASCFLEA